MLALNEAAAVAEGAEEGRGAEGQAGGCFLCNPPNFPLCVVIVCIRACLFTKCVYVFVLVCGVHL
jgi:hypothetical protein